MNERGQITIPKQIRLQAGLHPKDNLIVEVDGKDRVVIKKRDFFYDLEDLIRRDLVNEGYGEYEVASMITKRKRELGEALLRTVAETESEIEEGEYLTLDDLKADLKTD